VHVYSETIPAGTSLKLDIYKANDTGVASIFTTVPEIATTRTANTRGSRGSGGSVSAVKMDVITTAAVAPEIGQINAAANTVAIGERLMLYITQAGTSPYGGDDLLITVYIE
jgi:hypothetical protein